MKPNRVKCYGLIVKGFLLLTINLSLLTSEASAYQPTSDRLPNGALWDRTKIGVVGGIPTGWPVVVTIFTTNDYSDRVNEINAALFNARGTHSVVLLGPGDFYVSNYCQIAPGTILCGTVDASGHNLTHIYGPPDGMAIGFYAGGQNWDAETVGPYGTTLVTADRPAGSTTLSFPAPPSGPDAIGVGDIIQIRQVNDCGNGGLGGTAQPNETTFVDQGRDGTNDHAINQVLRITALTRGVYGLGTYDVTFDPPLRADYKTALLAQVRYQWSTWRMEYAGAEHLILGNWGNQYGSDNFEMVWDNAENCWATDLEVATGARGQMLIQMSKNIEVRRCYNHGGLQPTGGGGGSGYGLALEQSDDCRIEDNILSSVNDPIMAPVLIDNGSTGNVIVYNYIPRHAMIGTNMVEEIAFHSAGPMFNLIEGNVFNKLSADNYHGGDRNETAFRNWIKGNQAGATKVRHAVSISECHLNWSVIGNILGLADADTYDAGSSATLPAALGKIIWVVGFAYGNDAHRWDAGNVWTDARVNASLVRHGNWSAIDAGGAANPGQIWSASISDHTLPASYLYSTAPSYFGALTWPPINPAAGLPAADDIIPAAYRFLHNAEVPAAAPTPTPSPARVPLPPRKRILLRRPK